MLILLYVYLQIETYLQYCIQYDNPFTYSKYSVQNMLRELQDTPRGKAFLETQTLQEIWYGNL